MNIINIFRKNGSVSQQGLETILLKYKELVETGYKIKHMTGAESEISQIAIALISYPIIMDSEDVEPQNKKVIQQGLQEFLTEDNKLPKEFTDLAIKYYSYRAEFDEQLENNYSGIKEILALKIIRSLLSKGRYFDYRRKNIHGYFNLFIQDLLDNGYIFTPDPKIPESIQIGKIVEEETIKYNGEECKIYQISTENGIDFFNDGVEDLLNCVEQGNSFIINKTIIDKAVRNLIPYQRFKDVIYKTSEGVLELKDQYKILSPIIKKYLTCMEYGDGFGEESYQKFIGDCVGEMVDDIKSKIQSDIKNEN